jgi:hypothetical protein
VEPVLLIVMRYMEAMVNVEKEENSRSDSTKEDGEQVILIRAERAQFFLLTRVSRREYVV